MTQTPLEKAIDLMAKYNDLAKNDLQKQCALIAVEEILMSFPHVPSGDGFISPIEASVRASAYWQSVKEELNKL